MRGYIGLIQSPPWAAPRLGARDPTIPRLHGPHAGPRVRCASSLFATHRLQHYHSYDTTLASLRTWTLRSVIYRSVRPLSPWLFPADIQIHTQITHRHALSLSLLGSLAFIVVPWRPIQLYPVSTFCQALIPLRAHTSDVIATDLVSEEALSDTGTRLGAHLRSRPNAIYAAVLSFPRHRLISIPISTRSPPWSCEARIPEENHLHRGGVPPWQLNPGALATVAHLLAIRTGLSRRWTSLRECMMNVLLIIAKVLYITCIVGGGDYRGRQGKITL